MTSLRFVARALPLVIVALPTSGPAARADRFDDGSSRGAGTPAGRLSDADEIALALTAAPASITAGAAVYILRDGKFAKVRDGSTGWVCMVGRDPRVKPIAVAPLCYNPEGARTSMQEGMLKAQLWAQNFSNTAVQREVDAGYQRGTLQHPSKPVMIYMMSSHQVLESFRGDSEWTTGAWHPHIMIYLPHATADQFVFDEQNQAGPVLVSSDARGVQLVVVLPHWADNPASPDEAADHHDATTGTR
jgi:hypothetical protein